MPTRTSEITRQTPATEGWSPWDYWLGSCEGFRVETPSGRLGFVDEVRHDSLGRTVELAVRAGVLGRRLLVVAADDVEAICPERLRLRLAPGFSIVSTELERAGAGHAPAAR